MFSCRGPDESIVIDGHIRITVISVQGEKVRLGIEAPPDVRVDRQEVHERRLGRGLAAPVCVG